MNAHTKPPLRPDIWITSRSGAAIDMLNPQPHEVDFRQIADQLAGINRYAGAFFKPISVAQHTLIACDLAPMEVRPWVLLHDAHETRLGDIPAPAKAALRKLNSLALSVCPLRELETRHDHAIHAAAGLPMPAARQRDAIHHADLCALSTELRDFVGLRPAMFGVDPNTHPPAKRVYRLRAPDQVADELFEAFCTWLPALRACA